MTHGPRRRQLLIQIDGLSRPALERAMAEGAAPTLAALIDDSAMECISVYSGLPSTTPAAQGELFYGVRCAVPAFAYMYDRQVAQHMLDPQAADRVQRGLEQHDAGLLRDGSSYGNIYTGGAALAAFCPVVLARSESIFSRGMRYQLRVAAASIGVSVRSARMLLGELARLLSQRTHVRSTAIRRRLREAMQRISLNVVLRDSMRMAALHDLRHGVPIVHVNFLGYDKQAHRYGPESAAAFRALLGIDRAISSLIGALRDGDGDGDGSTIVVYSDHGQEATTSIRRIAGKQIDTIVHEAASDVPAHDRGNEGSSELSGNRNSMRRRLTAALREEMGERILGIDASRQRDASGRLVTVIEAGPIAHVYFEPRCSVAERIEIARGIAGRVTGVVALTSNDEEGVTACLGANGDPQAIGVELLCAESLVQHPFREWIAADLQRLVQHEQAGDIVILGTGFTDRPITFADECGSHAGPGPRETEAFAIVPHGFALRRSDGAAPARFSDLRAAVLADRADGQEE